MKRSLLLLVVFAATLVVTPAASAMADTFVVDKTGDADNEACTAAAGDCSLRSAVTAADGVTGTDTINFNSAVFTGAAATSTIQVDPVADGGNIVVFDGVTINGGNNCGPAGAVKPCVGLHVTSAGDGLDIDNGPTSVNGIAFTGASGDGILSQAAAGSTVTGSWFGVGLNGTTLDPNGTGVAFIPAASGTIGGSTAATRNVFADNTDDAVLLANGGGTTVKGNYMGTLPDGTAVANPGTSGVDIGNSPNSVIGGNATTAGSCDGACNLIVKYSGDGIVFNGPGSNGATISGNFIGLGLNGTADLGNGGSGIEVGNTAVTIGGASATQRNYIAGNDDVGVMGNAVSGLAVTNNYIGLSADGTASIPNTGGLLTSGISTAFNGTGTITGNRLGANGIQVGSNWTVQGNVIGVGPNGEDLGPTDQPGIRIDGVNNTIGGTGAGQGNTVGNVAVDPDPSSAAPHGAVFLESSSSTNAIRGNFIGTTATGVPAPNGESGIQLGGSNALVNNQIGGLTAAGENVISNSGTDAIAYTQGGAGNSYLLNLGRNNGSTANDLFIDSASNNGIVAPSGVSATSTSISGAPGSAVAGATILAYATYTGRGDLRTPLGTATAIGDGSWSIPFSSLPNGSCVTANQNDPSGDGSNLAPTVTIGGGACVPPPISAIDSGPAAASTIADSTPTFGFSSEAGATFQCRIDAGLFAACTSPFTAAVLADGSHTFQEQAVQTPVNPGLGTEVGAANSRTFTVDTTVPPGPPAPPAIIPAGPTGQRAAALKKCKKKKSAKARKKCKKKANQLPV
jgi:CSLREA domain-containing protein